MKPIIGITLGDFNGIGPEVTLKALFSPAVRKVCHPVLVGATDVYEWYARRLRMKMTFCEIERISISADKRIIPLLPVCPYYAPKMRPGTLSKESGAFAVEAIKSCVQYCLQGWLDGMVTAPVSKEGMQLAGYHFPGQTEMLSQLTRTSNVMMMLVAEKFRVGLATVHIPLKEVARNINIRRLSEKISILHASLKKDFRIANPKIAVLGLNPHAGENGMLGIEENRFIYPVVKKARSQGYGIEGPFPADGFFGKQAYHNYDAVLAMYHDQGLIPLKLVGFEKGVNFSAGLKIVRTSPDHGTGFDIAGKGIADPGSMIEAIKLAAAISKNRKRKHAIY